VISGNARFGVHITGSGTTDNRVTSNYIGTNGFGSSSTFNTVGVVIDSGAQRNTVGGTIAGEGNLISGNRAQLFPYGAGVLIRGSGSDYNSIVGNAIGLDGGGTRALRNGSAGVIIAGGARYNVIGGTSTAAANVISGNGSGELSVGIAAGVHIFGSGTSFNEVAGNRIGVTLSGLGVLANAGHGIGIFGGASDNIIGGDAPEAGNVITASDYHGVYVNGLTTARNLIRYNSIYDNDSLGMALANGAQHGVAAPVIMAASPDSATGNGAPANGRVDIYRAAPDDFGRGEALALVGTGIANGSGEFAIALTGVTLADTLTAMAIDLENNSSAFSINRPADPSLDVEDSDEQLLPERFVLEQNYPNPFNPSTTISYSLPVRSRVRLDIYNTLGQRVSTLASSEQPAGEYKAVWDGRSESGAPVASGVYLYRLSTDNSSSQKKMLLLK
ncbi:T9SS type A sorting domain-containing protein, partial [candidate division GN15 bacterium]|nr:T9SS type A sorting domain-containing protein [candidate division GN15 bacterium]